MDNIGSTWWDKTLYGNHGRSNKNKIMYFLFISISLIRLIKHTIYLYTKYISMIMGYTLIILILFKERVNMSTGLDKGIKNLIIKYSVLH